MEETLAIVLGLMKSLFFLLLWPLAGFAQPKIAILPTTNFWMEPGRVLRFHLVLTNSGNKPFSFGDRAKEPEKFVDWPPNVALGNLYESSLHDRTGNVVKYNLNAGVFSFRNKEKPELKARESVSTIEAGALNLGELENGVYTLVFRANPVGLSWPKALFDEKGSIAVLSIYGENVIAYRPPRPVLSRPMPGADIVERYKAQVLLDSPPPTPAPLPRKSTKFRIPGRWKR